MNILNAAQSSYCSQFAGLSFTESICTAGNTSKTKTEITPVSVDFQIALLIKKGIDFKIVNGRVSDKELVYMLSGVSIRNPFNYA